MQNLNSRTYDASVYAPTYHPTSGREWNWDVILGMAVPMIEVSNMTVKVVSVKLARRTNSFNPVRYSFSFVVMLVRFSPVVSLGLSVDAWSGWLLIEVMFSLQRRNNEWKMKELGTSGYHRWLLFH